MNVFCLFRLTIQNCTNLANVQTKGSVTRLCNGITTFVAVWSEVDFSGCGLSRSALQLCEANQVSQKVIQFPFCITIDGKLHVYNVSYHNVFVGVKVKLVLHRVCDFKCDCV